MSKRITVVGSTKENGELKRLSTSICYNKITLPNYEFDERDTIFCPVDMMIETSQLVSFETATTPSLLEGILSLIYRLPKQMFSEQALRFGTKKILIDKKKKTKNKNEVDSEKEPEEDLGQKFEADSEENSGANSETEPKINPNLIYTAEKNIGWCQVNGFPFMGEFDKQAGIIHRSRNGKLRSALHADSINARFSFSLENFLFHLNEIGNAYYLYTGIKGQVDKRNPAHFVTSSDKWTGFGMHYDDLEIIAKDSKTATAEEFKKIFEKKYDKINFRSRISFEKGLHIDVVADSLFDVAFYQLANLMYDDELELRVCPMCNAFFVPKHRNQKYCNSGECYPQKAYKRRKAAEKQRNSQTSKA